MKNTLNYLSKWWLDLIPPVFLAVALYLLRVCCNIYINPEDTWTSVFYGAAIAAIAAQLTVATFVSTMVIASSNPVLQEVSKLLEGKLSNSWISIICIHITALFVPTFSILFGARMPIEGVIATISALIASLTVSIRTVVIFRLYLDSERALRNLEKQYEDSDSVKQQVDAWAEKRNQEMKKLAENDE
ncbi:hypothetical protein [Rothia dentocariosa]|uniref:hypothetical protein n=1 Tax=Rothia dentocariosa TaxID=2047 RepID=UPI0028E23171|nr:hypothetical protein [Rothia dentocariosa]